ncbi:MAG: tetratricopeptide repeat protein [Verrucomicrobiota bacterium]
MVQYIITLLIASGASVLTAAVDGNAGQTSDSIIGSGQVQTSEQLHKSTSKAPSRRTSEERRDLAEALANFAMGRQAEERGKFADALKYYEQAAVLDKEFDQIPIRQALVHLRKQNIQKAVTLLQEHLEISPNSPDFHSLLAYCYTLKGDFTQAMSHARDALAGDPSLIANYPIIVEGLTLQGKNEEIGDLLQQAKDTESDDAGLYLRLGQMWLKILSNSNRNITKTEHYQKVLPLFNKALEINPDHSDLLVNVAEISFRAGEYDRAIELYEKILSQKENSPNVLEHLAIAFLATDNQQRAIEVLEKILEIKPQHTVLYPMLAELHLKQNNLEKAEDYYHLCTLMNDPDPRFYVQLLQIQLDRKDYEKTLETVLKAEKLFPNITNFKLIRAQVIILQKNYIKAEELLSEIENEALSRNPKLLTQGFYLEYASIAEKNKNYRTAERLLRKLIDLNPDDHQALNFLGYMWAELGINLAEAEAMIVKALSFQPNNPAYLDSLGWVYYKMEEYDEAIAYLKKSIKYMEPNVDPVIYDHLGDAYERTGQIHLAIETWQKALPQASDLKEALSSKIERVSKALSQQVRSDAEPSKSQ